MLMINKKLIVIAAFCCALLTIGLSLKPTGNNNNNTMLQVEKQPIKSGQGWGYNILVDHKIYIHQQWIPAIEGKKAFINKEEALKTADVAVAKLIRGKQPYITKQELDSLRISF